MIIYNSQSNVVGVLAMTKVDRALAILQKVLPSLTLKSFLQKIQPVVEQYRNLHPEEIQLKVFEYLKNEKPFGEAIAEGAESVLNQDPSYQRQRAAIINQIAEGEYGKSAQEDYQEVLSISQTVTDEPVKQQQSQTEPPLA
jgi:hypothetical protein